MTSAEILHRGRLLFRCRVLSHMFSWVKGLMFSRHLREREGVLFVFPIKRVVDIHTLFVFFSIDALWLDERGRVVAIQRRIKPFTLVVAGVLARYLVEVLGGTSDGIRVGERLTIKLKRKDS